MIEEFQCVSLRLQDRNRHLVVSFVLVAAVCIDAVVETGLFPDDLVADRLSAAHCLVELAIEAKLRMVLSPNLRIVGESARGLAGETDFLVVRVTAVVSRRT